MIKRLLPLLATSLIVPTLLTACGGTKETANPSTSPTTEANANVSSADNSLTKDWKDYSAQDGTYTIKFPVAPKEEPQSTDSALGKLDYVLVMSEDSKNGRAYLSSSIKYNLKEGQTYDVDKGLEGAKNGALNNTKSTLISEKEINKGDVKGKEIVFQNPQGLVGKAHIYIDIKDKKTPTLYQALVIAEKNVDFPEADAFLDSLTITK